MYSMSLFRRQTEGQTPQMGGQRSPKGPPYMSPIAVLGHIPKPNPDIPVTAVFILLFLLGAVGHMTILQTNLRRRHKFFLSGAMFGFCMARIIAASMRIAWAAHSNDVRVGIAASILILIGSLIGYVVNLLFAQRIIRALHPTIGWHRHCKRAFGVVFATIPISLGVLIGFTVASYYTLDPHKLRMSRNAGYYGATYFGVIAFLPIPLILLAVLTAGSRKPESFGTGSFGSKILIALFGSFILSLGAWYRAGTSYLPPRLRNNPAPYQSTAAFYIFYFTLEIIVIWSYLLTRIDQRFWVPDGSKGPGDYSRVFVPTIEMDPSPRARSQDAADGEKGAVRRSSASPERLL